MPKRSRSSSNEPDPPIFIKPKSDSRLKIASTRPRGTKAPKRSAEVYRHPEAESPTRPEVGTQAQFQKKKPPATYRYESSLSPALNWDGQNSARERGEILLRRIREAGTLEDAKTAATELERLGRPFLNWAGKADRLSFDVPTLPLFVHERLSTKAILETLREHKKVQQTDMFDLFGDPQRSIADQVLRSYEHRDKWVNRMILGDSLVVMNSLLHYEGLGGQVQMMYIDPPYGVKFGSNFQPFVRKRDVKHNDDEDMTREPEMVQAYRDTWELGLHSYLTYLRDRLLLARELLHPSGSVFVQISDENLHHVREVMEEVFGAENFLSIVAVRKTGGATSETLPTVVDFVIWYARDVSALKYRQLYVAKTLGEAGAEEYTNVELADRSVRKLTRQELSGQAGIPAGARPYTLTAAVSEGTRTNTSSPFTWRGITFNPGRGNNWKTSIEGMIRLCELGRIVPKPGLRIYKRYFSDFPYRVLNNTWMDVRGALDRVYVVQTAANVIQRCLLMTTDPGDLVLDPTCGSGTTAYVAEQWGRRWITIDTSRVPLALARQRLLTATYRWYELNDDARGPARGFVYKRKQNSKGEEVGGIVPHITLKSIANDEPPVEEVLVDQPETLTSITRVSGPFCLEATIPTPVDYEGDGIEDSGMSGADYGSFVDRMLEVLRRSPVLRLEGNRTVTLSNIRPPAKALTLCAEALVDASALGQNPSLMDVVDEAAAKRGDRLDLTKRPVAFVFGPENGAVSEKLVFNAAKDANAKQYTHLYVVGFAIQPNARELVETSAQALGIPATYVQATPDLLMGDLLKNMRSSQIFSVCGLPEIEVTRVKPKDKSDPERWQVTLTGLDVFDPVTMEVHHEKGEDVPAWFLDADYNERCFHVSQAFFPRTGAWESIREALKADYDESVWDHLSGTTSAPFEVGQEQRELQIL